MLTARQLESSQALLHVERSLRRGTLMPPAKLKSLADYYTVQLKQCKNPIGKQLLVFKIRQLHRLARLRQKNR